MGQGNVKGIMLSVFNEAYDKMSVIQQQRIIQNFSCYDNEILQMLTDSVLDSHKTRRPPTSDEIRQHLPSRAYDSERARKDMAALDDKQQNYHLIAIRRADDFMKNNELAIQAISEGWGVKLRAVVKNLEWMRAQYNGGEDCIGWDCAQIPIHYTPTAAKNYFNKIMLKFKNNPNCELNFSDDSIEYLSSYTQ